MQPNSFPKQIYQCKLSLSVCKGSSCSSFSPTLFFSSYFSHSSELIILFPFLTHCNRISLNKVSRKRKGVTEGNIDVYKLGVWAYSHDPVTNKLLSIWPHTIYSIEPQIFHLWNEGTGPNMYISPILRIFTPLPLKDLVCWAKA